MRGRMDNDPEPDERREQNWQAQSFGGFPVGMRGQTLSQPGRKTKIRWDAIGTDVTHINSSFVCLSKSSDPKFVPKHLNLDFFKLKPCPQGATHNHKSCPFFHNNKDRKRPGDFYSGDLCPFIEKKLPCPKGDSCTKSHNRVEQLYRPDKYKTKFCSLFPNDLNKCKYGTYCSFAHSEADMKIELIHNYEFDDDFFLFHYKTVFCPFNLSQHNKALCVYAHNWQDFRRKPDVFSYDPDPCPNWKASEFIVEYEKGCPGSFACAKCHGWKELEFHPLVYRTRPCLIQCPGRTDCPKFHSPEERRFIDNLLLKNVFTLVKKNRVVEGLFKVRRHPAEEPKEPNDWYSYASIEKAEDAWRDSSSWNEEGYQRTQPSLVSIIKMGSHSEFPQSRHTSAHSFLRNEGEQMQMFHLGHQNYPPGLKEPEAFLDSFGIGVPQNSQSARSMREVPRRPKMAKQPCWDPKGPRMHEGSLSTVDRTRTTIEEDSKFEHKRDPRDLRKMKMKSSLEFLGIQEQNPELEADPASPRRESVKNSSESSRSVSRRRSWTGQMITAEDLSYGNYKNSVSTVNLLRPFLEQEDQNQNSYFNSSQQQNGQSMLGKSTPMSADDLSSLARKSRNDSPLTQPYVE